MEFQHDKSWDLLIEIFEYKLTAKDAWNIFIDFHEQTYPKSYWTFLRNLDLNQEQFEIVDWLNQLLTTSQIPNNIIALWIGIVKFADNEKEIPTIYLVGSDSYNSDSLDWASDPSYLPENRYVQPELLLQIDNIAQTDKENYEFLDWILPLAYCTFTFDEIIRTKIDTKLLLKNKNKLFVSVGHEDGDYMDLSCIEKLK